MKKFIFLLIFFVGVGGAYYFWDQQQKPEDSSGMLAALKSQVDKLLGKQQLDNENELILYGNVDIREVQLAFNGSEHITNILVEEGEHVKKGQVLARLHNEILKAQLIEAEAQVEAQQQMVAKLKAGSRKEEIDKAKAELNASIAQSKAAVSTYKRLLPLVERKLITPDEIDKARGLADASQAQEEAVRQALILLQSGSRKEDIASAVAVLKSREAAVLLVKQRLEDAILYAPADGIIRNRILEPGSMAFPQTPVMTLAFVNPVWVRAYLPEPALGKVAPGSKALIYTDSYPDKAYEGWVGYISPTSEFTPKNIQTEELRTRLVYSMRIYACNPQNELRLGMPATVHIDVSEPPSSRTSNIKACENE